MSVPSVPEIPFPNPDDRVYVGPRINLTRTTAAEIPYLARPPGNPEFHREVDFSSPEQLENSLRSKLKESELPKMDSSQVLTLWHRRSQEMIGLCFYQWVAPGIGSIHGGLFDIQRRRSGAAAEGLVGAMGYFFREFKPDSLVNLVRADNLAVITLLMGLGWYGIGSYEESNSRQSLVFEIQQQDFGEQKIVRYLWGNNE